MEISYQYQKGWLSQQMMVLQNTPTFIFNYPSNKIAQNYKVERQIHIVKLGFILIQNGLANWILVFSLTNIS